MQVNQTENVTVRHMNFDDTNGTRPEVEDPDTTVDARHNWRGCPGGPDDPGCEDLVGDAVYNPWLTGPVADAGAS